MLACELFHQFHLHHRLFSAVDDLHEQAYVGPVKSVPYWHEHEVIEAYQQIYYERRPPPRHRGLFVSR